MTDIRQLRPMSAAEREAARLEYLQKCAVAFPLTSDEDVLFFSMSDLCAIEKVHGTDFAAIERKVMSGDSQAITDCLLIALKRPAGNGKFARVEIDAEDLDVPHVDAVKPILNALCMRYFGRSHDELIAEAEAKVEALRAELDQKEPAQ